MGTLVTDPWAVQGFDPANTVTEQGPCRRNPVGGTKSCISEISRKVDNYPV